MEIWLPWFASLDSDETTREAATTLATQISFSLCRAKKKNARLIDKLLADQSSVVRIAGLKHLAAIGNLADIPVVESLQRDDDKDVRTEAERTKRLIYLKANPDMEVKRSVETNDHYDDELVGSVAEHIEKLTEITLLGALKHTDSGLRVVVARELVKRGNLTAELSQQMCADESKGVRECGYLARVRSGELRVPRIGGQRIG